MQGTHIKADDLIDRIEESEKEPETADPAVVRCRKHFCSRHYTLIRIALSVMGILIAVVALGGPAIAGKP